MTAKSNPATLAGDREIVATRTFDAPRELVFEVWTDPEHIGRWWGPEGFTTTTHAMEMKPGGVWRFVMHGPDGTDYQNKITFLEVVRPERLVYEHRGDKDGEPVHFRTTVTFEEQGKKTCLTMRMTFPSADARDYTVKTYGALEGLDQTLDRLREYVTGRPQPRGGSARVGLRMAEKTCFRQVRGMSGNPAPRTGGPTARRVDFAKPCSS